MNPPFAFEGTIAPSKSLLIRHLLLRLYEPRISIADTSQCDDVMAMQGACAALQKAAPREGSEAERPEVQTAAQPVIFCGESGLVLRLCLGYAARRGGDFLLTGTKRLLERPHAPLFVALQKLGAHIEVKDDAQASGLRVRSAGWQPISEPIRLVGGLSSQFASSLLLNAWNLPFKLVLECDREPISQGYLEMSITMAQCFGMNIQKTQDASRMWLEIPPFQAIKPRAFRLEADVSSAFAVAALAAVSGQAWIQNFPATSQQPDHCFVGILQKMGVPIELTPHGLRVERAERLAAIEVDLGGAPDLFPVLAVLCALADGCSLLCGAPQLRAKESDRVATTSALLSALGRKNQPRDDGMMIFGAPLHAADLSQPVSFDATGDHRLGMAAVVARAAGFPISIFGFSSVKKSFPELFAILQPPSHSIYFSQ